MLKIEIFDVLQRFLAINKAGYAILVTFMRLTNSLVSGHRYI